MSTSFDYQLFVIGGGSGGVRAARVAASLGAKVAIVEKDRYGGTCVIRGCVPKKLLVYAAQYSEHFTDAQGFGWTVPEAEFSWPDLIAAKDKEISRLSGLYERNLANSKVTVLHGDARVVDAHTVEVNGQRYTSQHILIATGGKAFLPQLPGIEHAITSNEAFDLPTLPKRVLVVGGGYIAVEFSGIFNGLGSQTVVSHRGNKILRGFDEDVRDHLQGELQKKGITLRLNDTVAGIVKNADGSLDVTFSNSADVLNVEVVMYATGRRPNSQGLGLEALGVQFDEAGGIQTNEWGSTHVPSIHAVGDVTNGVALTPVAIREGSALAHTLFGAGPINPGIFSVPTAVFSQPSVGTVGLTQEQALAQFESLDIYKGTFRNMRHTLAGNEERTLVKLIVDTASQKVLGAHMVGSDAPEIIQGLAIAIRMGATKADFDATVALHPSAAEEFVTLRDKTTVHR